MEDIKAEEDEKRRKKQAVLERYEEVKEEAKIKIRAEFEEREKLEREKTKQNCFKWHV